MHEQLIELVLSIKVPDFLLTVRDAVNIRFYRIPSRRQYMTVVLSLLIQLLYSTSPSRSLQPNHPILRHIRRFPLSKRLKVSCRTFHCSSRSRSKVRSSPITVAVGTDFDSDENGIRQPFHNLNKNDMNVALLKYLRWSNTVSDNSINHNTSSSNNNNNRMELQTRVTTFQRYRNVTHTKTSILETIQLHGQFHFADDKQYYQYYTTDPKFVNHIDSVFYELLVDESLLLYVTTADQSITRNVHNNIRNPQKRRLQPSTLLQASVSDESIARQYNWYCQVNCMEYNNNNNNNNNNNKHRKQNWYHADFTRQEFVAQLQQQQQQKSFIDDRRPLWQQAGGGNRDVNNNGAIVVDATTALLVGPPLIVQQQQQAIGSLRTFSNASTPTTMTGLCSLSLSSLLSISTIRRRIFTNLFLPGDGFAVWLRYILWITIPSPELSILLIDWSSSWGSSSTTSQTSREPMSSSQSSTNKSSISPIALPLLQALSQGRFNDVRRLVFGQVALTGHHQATVSAATNSNNSNDENSLLITKRNDHALQQIFVEFDRQHADSNNCTLALLYGCNHCPDIHVKLMQGGFHPTETQWRTAWSVSDAPSLLLFTNQSNGVSDASSNHKGTNSIGFLVLCLLPLYFLIGGYDWMETIVDVVRAFENNDDIGSASTILIFYITRHVLLYLSLSKFVLDGDNSN